MRMNFRFFPTSPVLKRQERDRGPFERPAYNYGVGHNVYSGFRFEPFNSNPYMSTGFGTRGRLHRHRIMVDTRSGWGDDYHDSGDETGEVTGGQLGGSSRMNFRSADLARQGPPGVQKTALPFGKAMNKLHQQIVRSEEFYSTFKSEYDNDVERIKNYANDESLLSLWVLRVKGERDPKVTGNHDRNDEELAETAEKIHFMKNRLRDAFAEALFSTMNNEKGPGRKGLIRYETAKRLKEKVALANSQVSALLDQVPKGPEYCIALLAEFEKLKFMLNPDDVKNKEMYAGADSEKEEQWNGGM